MQPWQDDVKSFVAEYRDALIKEAQATLAGAEG